MQTYLSGTTNYDESTSKLMIWNGHAHLSAEIHKLERKNIRTPAICGELVRRKKIKTAANFLTVGNSLDKSCPLKKIQRV